MMIMRRAYCIVSSIHVRCCNTPCWRRLDDCVYNDVHLLHVRHWLPHQSPHFPPTTSRQRVVCFINIAGLLSSLSTVTDDGSDWWSTVSLRLATLYTSHSSTSAASSTGAALLSLLTVLANVNTHCALDSVADTQGYWWCSSVVERRSLTGELSLACAWPAADG